MIGDYDEEYPREKLLRRGLERNDVRVLECRFSDSAMFPGAKKLLYLPYFYLVAFVKMRRVLRETDRASAVLLTKFNPLFIPFAAYYARKLDCELVYDLFVSLARTAEMREVHPALVKLVYAAELVLYRLPDRHIAPTDQFINMYSGLYHVERARFIRLPPGADEEWFYPRPDVERLETFTAVYWGNFLPHHGVDTIVDAADELRDENIDFVFLGSGPHLDRYRAEAERRGLDNVEFRGRVPMEELTETIARAHVCFGMFSSHPRALASISTKVSEAIAMRKAVVVERSPAVQQWFEHGESAYMVPPDDGGALADGLRALRGNPDLIERLESGGRRAYEVHFSNERIGSVLYEELISNAESRRRSRDAHRNDKYIT